MIRLTSLSLPFQTPEAQLPAIAARLLGISSDAVHSVRLVRRSIDARRKDDIRLVLTLDVDAVGDEAALCARSRHPQTAPAPVAAPFPWKTLAKAPARRPLVVGSGPAGLFAALTLAKAGARPLLIERGQDAETRRAQVAAFWAGGPLDAEGNALFGEGGAGTFSDGKLNTGIKNPRCAVVLDTFVRAGAPEAIRWQTKPHVGTDHLVRVVQNIRREIIALGGEVRFGTALTGLQVEGGRVRGVTVCGEAFDTDTVVLCIGHSARDTFAMLHEAGVAMVRKPFSIGARIEHPQALIDRAQYGGHAGDPALGAADYKLSAHLPNGRGVYTFCMCPGGVVVAAASQPGGVVTNGMSYYARDGENANSALLVDIRPEDFPGDDPLAGLAFQRQWEAAAFAAGGRDFRAPVQRVEDFLAGRESRALGDVQPTYRPGVTPADLRACLPETVVASMQAGLRLFDRRLRGFASPDALLTGVETRSSCPLRIPRDEGGEASVRGLFPAGEGAGYAGGILSAAVDGMQAAERVLAQYAQDAVL